MSEVIVPEAETAAVQSGYDPKAALKSVTTSILVNAVAPFAAYKILAPHFVANSIVPLLYASAFPFLGLVWGLVRTRVVDAIAAFAIFGIAYTVGTTLLAGEVHRALILGATQGFVIAAFFLGSVLIRRPVVFFIARQFTAGNDPVRRERFAAINELDRSRTFNIATLVWTGGILFLSVASLTLAVLMQPATYLLVNNILNTAVNILLAVWSIRFMRKRLEPLGDRLQTAAAASA
jgi:hypothetical protein